MLMKKLFTSMLVLAAALCASAQDFTLTGADGVEYHDGDVVNVGYTPGRRPNTGTWDPELMVTINKVSAISQKAQLKVTANLVGTPEGFTFAQFCGLDGQCAILTAEPTTKTQSYALNAVAPLEIDAVNKPVADAPVEIKVTVATPSQTLSLTLNFLAEEKAGIDNVETSAPAISLSGRVVHYNLPMVASQFTLYNISGRQVVNRTVSGVGSLNLGGFPAGVYVYRCGALTGKLLLH